MSQLFVDEIREHTSGNGILIADNVVLLGPAPAYHTFPVNILFEVSGGQDATVENAYGLIVDLHGGSVVNPAAYLSAAEFTAASAPALGAVGYLLGVSAYLEPGAGTVHRWTWAYYAQANPSAGGDSVYNFRGEVISGAGAADHAQLSLGPVSGGTAHNYGIILEDVTGTGAFAIKTGLGHVNFGDSLIVGTDPGVFGYGAGFFLVKSVDGKDLGIEAILVGTSTITVSMDGMLLWTYGPDGKSFTRLTSLNVYANQGTGGTISQISTIYIGPPEYTSVSTYAAQLYIDDVSGNAPTNYGIFISGFSGGTVNNYGIFIGDVTGTGAFAIKTGAGVVSIGDLLLTTASVAGGAKLRVPHGTAPSSPVDGDIWTTTAGIFVRINGVTVGPLT